MLVIRLVKKYCKGNILFPLVLIIILAVFLFDTFKMPSRPRMMLMYVQLFTVVLLVLEVVKNVVSKDTYISQIEKKDLIKTVISFLILFVFILIVNIFGYILSSILTFTLLALLWGARNYKSLVISNAIIFLMLYMVFIKIFTIQLPEGLLF